LLESNVFNSKYYYILLIITIFYLSYFLINYLDIRILLLEPVKNNYLVKTLYGILMLLPQGKAYQALSKRLKNVEMLYRLDTDLNDKKNIEIDIQEINHYLEIFSLRHNY